MQEYLYEAPAVRRPLTDRVFESTAGKRDTDQTGETNENCT